MDTKYEPGTVKVVAYNDKGEAVAETEVHTAGKPSRIELSADRKVLSADGEDLAFVTVKVVDKDGNLCPDAAEKLKFKVSGALAYRAACNGDPTCLEQFHLPQMTTFSGMLVVVVQSQEVAGLGKLTVSGKGLKSASIEIESTSK